MHNITDRFETLIRGSSWLLDHQSRALPEELKMLSEGALTMHYAPFDWVNTDARVVIVGITPGVQQAVNALREYRQQLVNGADRDEALRAAKSTGSFSGPMRNNLVSLLDYARVNEWLGIGTCASLFGPHQHLVHTTSLLNYPVLVNGANYSGTPDMMRTACLRDVVESCFVPAIRRLNNPLLIPLGPKVENVLGILEKRGLLESANVLPGIPHPSGANAERIAYMLRKKSAEACSVKTNTNKIDLARDRIHQVMGSLIAAQ